MCVLVCVWSVACGLWMWCGCPLWVCVSTATESVGLLGLACSARCVCVLGTTHSLAPSACFTPFWEIGSTVYCHASPPEPITADALPACLPLWPSNHTVTCTPLSLAWNCRDAVRGHAGIAALCLVSHSSRSPGASAGQRAIHARLHPGCAVKSRSQFGSVVKTAHCTHGISTMYVVGTWSGPESHRSVTVNIQSPQYTSNAHCPKAITMRTPPGSPTRETNKGGSRGALEKRNRKKKRSPQ